MLFFMGIFMNELNISNFYLYIWEQILLILVECLNRMKVHVEPMVYTMYFCQANVVECDLRPSDQ